MTRPRGRLQNFGLTPLKWMEADVWLTDGGRQALEKVGPPARVRRGSAVVLSGFRQPRSRLRTFCLDEFACASIAVEACERIWPRARFVDSLAKSASTTCERAV